MHFILVLAGVWFVCKLLGLFIRTPDTVNTAYNTDSYDYSRQVREPGDYRAPSWITREQEVELKEWIRAGGLKSK
jgi:hypothetical protein